MEKRKGGWRAEGEMPVNPGKCRRGERGRAREAGEEEEGGPEGGEGPETMMMGSITRQTTTYACTSPPAPRDDAEKGKPREALVRNGCRKEIKYDMTNP